MSKAISHAANEALKDLKKDERYKFVVQVTVGENNGQGVRVASRCYWDEDTDDVAFVSF
jgi:tctex1 domain-containing protein 2